jgi:hypothetical protein
MRNTNTELPYNFTFNDKRILNNFEIKILTFEKLELEKFL